MTVLGIIAKRGMHMLPWEHREGLIYFTWVTERRPEEQMCPFWEAVFFLKLQEGIILDGRNVQPEETKPGCNWR